MPLFVESIIVFAVILVIARFIKRGSTVLQKFFIPSALVAGVGGLIFGPQVLGTIPADLTQYWHAWPKYLITVVFAGLFLGKTIPNRKQLWKMSGPMIAFGNTLAWGQYVLGTLLTLLILVPFFGTNPMAGGLIEIGFEGGHGTAAGLQPTFAKLGWPEGTDIALALATISIVMAIILGILFVNLHNRRLSRAEDRELEHQQRQKMIRSGYNLLSFGRKIQTSPKAIVINVLAFTSAIGIGWLILKGLILAENFVLQGITDLRFFAYLPLFPLAMIGGLAVQMLLRKIGHQGLIQRRTAQIISTMALDVLVASAVATVSLNAIQSNLAVIIIFSLTGVIWIAFGFLVLAPRMFKTYWFEKGITNMGQSMGMTATGLLLGRLADPNNHSKARESFGYKQLAFEPFMGGGIVTVASVVLISEFGLVPVLVASSIITLFWLVLGLYLGKHKKPQGTN